MNHSPDETRAQEPASRRAEEIKAWLSQTPHSDFLSGIAECQRIQKLIFEECAARLSAPMNQFCAQQPAQLYADKSKLARTINAVLGSVHLCVMCDNSNRPGVLLGNPGKNRDEGRFVVYIFDEDGGRRVTKTYVSLPNLRIGVRPPNTDRSAHFAR